MTDWLPGGRERTRRLQALEAEVARLRAEAAAAATRLDGAADQAREDRAIIEEVRQALAAAVAADAAQTAALRLATAELDDLRDAAKAVAAIELRLASLEDQAGPKAARAAKDKADADENRFLTMQTAIKRAEHQLEIYAEEARKTGAALLERLEAARREYGR